MTSTPSHAGTAPPTRHTDKPTTSHWVPPEQATAKLPVFRGRVTGLDAARAIAVIGMFAQHFYTGHAHQLRWSDPSSWHLLVNNNSTMLFALLAGVAKSLIDGGQHPPQGVAQLQARTRIMTRALILFLLSGVLVTFIPNPGSVLGYIAAGFIVSLPFLRVAPKYLFLGGAIGLVVLPYPIAALSSLVVAHSAESSSDSSVTLLITGICPALIFLPVYCIGIGIGRCDLRNTRCIATLGVAGLTSTVCAFMTSSILTDTFGPIRYTGGSPGSFILPDWHAQYNVVSPHINGVLQVIVGVGIAFVVTAACLAVTKVDALNTLLYPLRALGMCAFTAYMVQFACVAVLWGNDPRNYNPTTAFFIELTVGLLIGSALWLRIRKRGPLEGVMNWCADSAAKVHAAAR